MLLATTANDAGSVITHDRIERVLRCGAAGFACGARDVALRCRHRFVTEELHQRVHADPGVGQLGRVGVPEAVYQGTAHRLGVCSAAAVAPAPERDSSGPRGAVWSSSRPRATSQSVTEKRCIITLMHQMWCKPMRDSDLA
jgi:hypothetical protein